MNIVGRSVVVTGGSQGLGRALGAGLAEQGARVVLVARHAEPLHEAVAAIRARGGEAYAVVADVAELPAAHAIAGQAAALVGPVDVLINNASSLGSSPLRPLLDTDCEDLERALAVNLVGPFRLSKVLLGSMVLRRTGLVINVSSDAAVAAYPNWGAYGAAKAALDHLTRIWAAELEGSGVRCVAIDPGEMATRLHHEAVPEADRSTLASPEAVARRIVAWIARSDALQSGARLIVEKPSELS